MDIQSIKSSSWVVQGKQIEIKPMYLKQQALLNKYSNIATASQVIYADAIAETGIDALLLNFPDEARKFGANLVKKILNTFVIDELVRAGDYTLSVENYFNTYYLRVMENNDSLFLKAVDNVRKDISFNQSLYNQTVSSNERKFENRIQIDALGGNGIVNTIKGAVTAYAINSVIDFASSFSTTMKNNDAYRNLESSIARVKSASSVYSSLVEGFWIDIRNCYIAEEYYWDDRHDYINYPDSKDRNDAAAIIGNLKLGRIPSEEKLASLIKALELDPFCSESYLYALEHYPNENAFMQLGKIFVPNTIEKVLQNYFVTLCSNSGESNYVEVLNRFGEYLNAHGFSVENIEDIEYVKNYVNLECEKNRQKKIFKGIEFPDEETACGVRNEYEEVVRLMQKEPEKIFEMKFKYIDLKKVERYLSSEV